MSENNIPRLSENDLIKLRSFLLQHSDNRVKLALIKFFSQYQAQVTGKEIGISRRYVTSSEIALKMSLPEEDVKNALREFSKQGIAFYYESLSDNEICYLDTDSHSPEVQEGFEVASRLARENPDLLDTVFNSLTKNEM